jgi:hypothetical protein
VGLEDEGVAVYGTDVSAVCPAREVDCTTLSPSWRRLVTSSSELPTGLAMDPSGENMVITARNDQGETVYVAEIPESADDPGDTGTAQPVSSASSEPATAFETASTAPAESDPPTSAVASEPAVTADATDRATEAPTRTASATPHVTTAATPARSAEPSASEPPVATPRESVTAPAPSIVPPPSPGGGEQIARPILRGFVAAGAPPAWSPNSKSLAFSAMPADGRHGPDLYIWHPGDAEAMPLTTDHRSYFASWAGLRIVINRVVERFSLVDPEAAAAEGPVRPRLAPRVSVLDPRTGEERAVRASGVWLPSVDPTGTWAVFWRGRLERDGPSVRPATGGLYLARWDAFDPFRRVERAIDATVPSRITASEALGRPVVDWHVRWTRDGRAMGIWIADEVRSDRGVLTVLPLDRALGLLADATPILAETAAGRAFTLGRDRVAWADPDGAAAQVLVLAWGADGLGRIRLRDLRVRQGLPGF